jgi:hypothetical protein
MTNKKISILSKGWLIIGIVLLFTGNYMIILANSLYSDSSLIDIYASSEIIEKLTNHISMSVLFLIITSIIIIIIGIIMCVEWISFSKFLKRNLEK